MSLPEKSGKGYLELRDHRGVAVIEGEPKHIAELEALLTQRGIPCTIAPAPSGYESLLLGADADRAAAQEVLDAYKAAKGREPRYSGMSTS